MTQLTFARAINAGLRKSLRRARKLPPEMGEGQQWNRKPGNLFSKPQKMHLDPSGGAVRIALTEKIPPIEPPKDTAYVKHLRIQSKLLSDFWGRPMYLGAIVVLPEGYEQHPEAHYPLLIEQGPFPADFSRFRTEMPAVWTDSGSPLTSGCQSASGLPSSISR